MATIAMMVSGALVNALAFSGSNFLFSSLGGGEEERKRHDLALEELTAARNEWNKKREKRLDYINEQLRLQGHAVRTFSDVDEAMREYNRVTGSTDSGGPEPQLSDFYEPSVEQQEAELIFVLGAMGVIGFFVYTL